MSIEKIVGAIFMVAAAALVIYFGFYLTLGIVILHFLGKVW